MLESLTLGMEWLEEVLWTYLGFTGIVVIGLWFTWRSKFAQIRLFPGAIRYALKQASLSHDHNEGIHPMKAFWATLAGAVGIGNVVGICSAVQIGGPGAVFWVWLVAFIGVLLKYTEVYLGMIYRKRRHGGWDGGPMYYLREAYGARWMPALAAVLLCIYGVEVYQFHVVVDAISINWSIPRTIVMLIMIPCIFLAVRGGMKSLSKIAAAVVPFMIVLYLLMTSYVLLLHIADLPGVFGLIFKSAFQGHAALGGFVGSTFMQTFSQGIARGCYASDIGIGYTSILHTETSETNPGRQASLTFVGILADLLGVCTISMLLILVTGVWQEPIDQTMQVQEALSRYCPGVSYLMPILIFFLGYTTVIAFFVFGAKAAKFLMPRYGETLYYVYALIMFVVFTYSSTRQALLIMSISGVTLLIINLGAFLQLHRHVRYDLE